MAWTDELQQASFRGVPFGVEGLEDSYGRQIAQHLYPYKNKPWNEDVGRGPREYQVSGFLISDSLIYQGGAAIDQYKALVAAVETQDAGELIHPLLGSLQVNIPKGALRVTARMDEGRVLSFTMLCLESGEKEFPDASQDTGNAVDDAADDSDDAAGEDFDTDAGAAIDDGQDVLDEAVSTANEFVAQVQMVAGNAASWFNCLANLPGNFGRYVAGATSGFAAAVLSASAVPAQVLTALAALGVVAPAGGTGNITQRAAQAQAIDALINQAITNNTAIGTACDNLVEIAGGTNIDANTIAGGIPQAIAVAAATVVAAVAAAATNPADAITALAQLAAFTPADPFPASVIGTAEQTMQVSMSAALRRVSINAMARVSATYQPSSADDAASIRDLVAGAIETEVAIAGDAGDDECFLSLQQLKSAVVTDLNTRGAGLPELTEVITAAPLPACVLAQLLYQDATRQDQLIAFSNVPHPAFMPTDFDALAS